MNEINEKYLSMMLAGYKQNLEGISQAITRLEDQIAEALEAQADMQKSVEELEEVLGVEPEEEEESGE